MDWLSSNWVWVVFIVAMLGMHLFGHGHGGHGKGGHGCCGVDRDSKDAERKPDAAN